MPNPPKLQEHLENLAFFTDRQDRIEALISLADGYRHKDSAEVPRLESTKVPGCESEVFVAVEPQGGGLAFKYAVDNPQGISAMAMATILEDALSGIPRDEVLGVSEEIVFEIFGRELSMGKNLGLTNMLRVSKQLASQRL
jgi:cysteine desulfuration protein SufE